MAKTLRLILGDQLNHKHSWFTERHDDVLYVIAELREEASYVRHHVQKVCAFFAAMEAFARSLTKDGHKVLYLTLDDTKDDKHIALMLNRLCRDHDCNRIEYQQPDEWRLLKQLRELRIDGVSIIERETEHFTVPFSELPKYFKSGKASRMEAFYRKLRKQHNILLEDGLPFGGQWNYDTANRKKLKKQNIDDLPEPLVFANDVTPFLARIKKHNIETIGHKRESLLFPINRSQSIDLLTFFCQNCLPDFGRFQDAMTCQSDHRWSLYHSRLSFSLNTKMLHPMEVIDAAIAAWRDNDEIDIAQVEGFVRQILGWREFVRGIYWANMPDYAELNALNAKKDLPDYFWTGKTRMRCMAESINQSLDYAYAHHIQRLMITGNFCLLAGIEPSQVDEWYLGIYIDALEWVEMPNTRGMSQFSDNGIVGSKPYAASSNYVHKMSDYCQHCEYDRNNKTGENACPFNSLYWHFMERHRDQFESNPRIGMVYRNWDKQTNEVRKETLVQADYYLSNLSSL